MEFYRFFSLTHDPFSRPESPDDAIITDAYSRTIAQARSVVDADRGIAVLTGAPGSGKSTLSALALSGYCTIQPLAPAARLTSSHLYDAILSHADMLIPRSLERRARAARSAIQGLLAEHESIILHIDQAESVSSETLCAARTLREISGVFAPPISLLLTGTTPLLRRLQSDVSLAGIDIHATRIEIGPVNAAEYLAVACSQAGRAAGEIFSPDGVEAISQASHTISEVICTARRAMMFACQIAEPVVTAEIVSQVTTPRSPASTTRRAVAA